MFLAFLRTFRSKPSPCLLLLPNPWLGFSHCMRVKRPVTFRMAPKKSTKGKDVETGPTRDEGWTPSKCSESDLESLVKQGFLPSKSLIQWRPSLSHDCPYENTGEIFALISYFERGLGLSCSNFFSRLLYYYGIQLLLEICSRGNHISLYLWLIKCSLNINGWQLVLINAYVKYLWNSILVWIF